MPTTTENPNEAQAEFWNGSIAHRFVDAREALEPRLEPFGRATMDGAGITGGEHVLDVGCGCGEPSVELARRVGDGGSVLGLDVSEVMLAAAREHAQDIANLRFEHGDAQIYPFEARSTDLVFSRFGVMFFADSVAAFANLKRALRPEGRVSFACWQGLQKNPWMAVPLSVVARHVEPPPPAAPGTPGPLAFADPDFVREILTAAGFSEITVAPVTPPMNVGATVDDALEFLTKLGPSARMLQDASDEVRAAAAKDLREALEPFATESGIELGASAWVVTGR